jgi:hypothetical protein
VTLHVAGQMALISLRNAKLVRFDKSRPHWPIDGINIPSPSLVDFLRHECNIRADIGVVHRRHVEAVLARSSLPASGEK